VRRASRARRPRPARASGTPCRATDSRLRCPSAGVVAHDLPGEPQRLLMRLADTGASCASTRRVSDASAAASARRTGSPSGRCSSCAGDCDTAARTRTSASCAAMNPSSGVSSSDPNFVSGSSATRMSSTERRFFVRSRYCASSRLELVRHRHAGDRADLPRREPLHHEPVEGGLVDAAEQRDDRLDVAVGAAAQVEVVRVPHDGADADAAVRGADVLQRLADLGHHDEWTCSRRRRAGASTPSGADLHRASARSAYSGQSSHAGSSYTATICDGSSPRITGIGSPSHDLPGEHDRVGDSPYPTAASWKAIWRASIPFACHHPTRRRCRRSLRAVALDVQLVGHRGDDPASPRRLRSARRGRGTRVSRTAGGAARRGPSASTGRSGRRVRVRLEERPQRPLTISMASLGVRGTGSPPQTFTRRSPAASSAGAALRRQRQVVERARRARVAAGTESILRADSRCSLRTRPPPVGRPAGVVHVLAEALRPAVGEPWSGSPCSRRRPPSPRAADSTMASWSRSIGMRELLVRPRMSQATGWRGRPSRRGPRRSLRPTGRRRTPTGAGRSRSRRRRTSRTLARTSRSMAARSTRRCVGSGTTPRSRTGGLARRRSRSGRVVVGLRAVEAERDDRLLGTTTSGRRRRPTPGATPTRPRRR
jgi:hypothetical protein